MTLSDRERRLLADMARRLEEQEPELASALRGSDEPAPRQGHWVRRLLVGWREKFRESEHAPLRVALAGGVLFFGGLFLAGSLTEGPAPGPGAKTEMPIFAEQNLLPEPAPPSIFRIGP